MSLTAVASLAVPGIAQARHGSDDPPNHVRQEHHRFGHDRVCRQDGGFELALRAKRMMLSLMDTSRYPILKIAPAGWRRFRRLTQLSFPRSYPIIQFPNAPLILAFVSGLIAQHSHGLEHADAQAVSYLSMAVWAYLELFQGVNTFRRLLGLAYTASTAVHLASALHH